MKIAFWLVRLYPAEWRARYGAEFAAVLEQRPPTLGDMFDIMLGALDAHWCLASPIPLTERIRQMMQRLRAAEITVFAAYIALVVAGLSFNTGIDDSGYLARNGGPLAPDPFHFNGQPLSVAYFALEVGAAVALLAVLAGGAPLALAVWRRAPEQRRLFFVPVAAFLLAVVTPLALSHAIAVNGGPRVYVTDQNGSAGALALAAWFVAWAAASVWAVARAVGRSEIPPSLVRFAFWPMVATTLAMALMTGALLAWGLFAHQQEPSLFDTLNPFTGTSSFGLWLMQTGVMALATAVAVAATVRSIGARAASGTVPAVAA